MLLSGRSPFEQNTIKCINAIEYIIGLCLRCDKTFSYAIYEESKVKGKHDYLKGFIPKFYLQQITPWASSDIHTNTETFTDHKCKHDTPASERHYYTVDNTE